LRGGIVQSRCGSVIAATTSSKNMVTGKARRAVRVTKENEMKVIVPLSLFRVDFARRRVRFGFLPMGTSCTHSVTVVQMLPQDFSRTRIQQ
jgi:hypothetical protein